MLRRDQPKENTMLIRSHHSGFIHPHSSEITPQPLYLRRREFLQWTAAGSMAAAAGTALAQSGPQAALRAAISTLRMTLPARLDNQAAGIPLPRRNGRSTAPDHGCP
jgi:hypothetical protein